MEKLRVAFNEHDDYLQVLVSGTYDLDDAVGEFPSVLAACKRTGLAKVLIDFRELTGNPAATQKILYAFGILKFHNEYRSSGGHPVRLAYLGSPPLVSTYEPELEVAEQEGLDIQLFTEADTALAWLLA